MIYLLLKENYCYKIHRLLMKINGYPLHFIKKSPYINYPLVLLKNFELSSSTIFQKSQPSYTECKDSHYGVHVCVCVCVCMCVCVCVCWGGEYFWNKLGWEIILFFNSNIDLFPTIHRGKNVLSFKPACSEKPQKLLGMHKN